MPKDELTEGPKGVPLDGRFFEAIAEHLGAAYLRYSFTKGTTQEVGLLWEVMDLAPGMRVLDAGCGPGRHVGALTARGVEVVGLDISAAFLRLLPGGWPLRADVRQLPVRPGSFDAAICRCQGGFGLLGGVADELVLGELAGAVRPGGRVGVTAFSAYFALRYLEEGDHFDAATGVNHERTEVRGASGPPRQFDLWTTCFTPRELRLMAAAAGLRPTGLWSVGPGDYAARPPDLEHPELLMIASKEPGSTMSMPPEQAAL
jgi:SAM-dependent methyltransferase